MGWCNANGEGGGLAKDSGVVPERAGLAAMVGCGFLLAPPTKELNALYSMTRCTRMLHSGVR